MRILYRTVLVAFMSGRKEIGDIMKFIAQEPLMEIELSLQGFTLPTAPQALYFGVGLCNGCQTLTTGLPVDILSMVLAAERLAPEKHILIADTHALTDGFAAASVDKAAGEQRETLQRAVDNLSLSGWSVVRASDIDHLASYTALVQQVSAPHEYIRRELADMIWFQQEKGIDLKLGWALNGSRNSDEAAFDRRFREQFGDALSFVYTVPGRTFNPGKIRAAPYFCDDPEARILLRAGEDVAAKAASARERFGSHATRAYENFLNAVVRLYDKTVGQTERGPLAERLQQVIGRGTQ